MKKWLFITLLFAILCVSLIADVTYKVDVYDRALGRDAYVSVNYAPPAGSGWPPMSWSSQMSCIGSTGRSINGVGGRIFAVTHENNLNGWYGLNATVTYGSQTRNVQGMLWSFNGLAYFQPPIVIAPELEPNPK